MNMADKQWSPDAKLKSSTNMLDEIMQNPNFKKLTSDMKKLDAQVWQEKNYQNSEFQESSSKKSKTYKSNVVKGISESQKNVDLALMRQNDIYNLMVSLGIEHLRAKGKSEPADRLQEMLDNYKKRLPMTQSLSEFYKEKQNEMRYKQGMYTEEEASGLLKHKRKSIVHVMNYINTLREILKYALMELDGEFKPEDQRKVQSLYMKLQTYMLAKMEHDLNGQPYSDKYMYRQKSHVQRNPRHHIMSEKEALEQLKR